MSANSWLVWQLADSAFPAGGFAHSGGLEAAWQHGEVRGRAELTEYLRTALAQLAHNAMPFAHASFTREEDLLEIDQHCDAFLSNHVANRVSRLQGQAFVASVERTFGSSELKELRARLVEGEMPGHFAVVFGTIIKLLGLNSDYAPRLFVFLQLRGWISAAVRLNIIGPLEGQGIQHQLSEEAERTAMRFGEVALDDVAQSAPLLDLWQGTQDRLYSRLFQS